MSIFIIDDHPLMREAISLLLKRLSTPATVVELDRLSAVAAAVIEHGAPELICLDLKLPDAQGVSGIVELKQQFPARRWSSSQPRQPKSLKSWRLKTALTHTFKSQPARPKLPMCCGCS